MREEDAESVLAWVKNKLSPKTTAPEDFDWLLLADVFYANARNSQNGSGWPDRTWAKVATAIYDRLADDPDRQKTGSRESFTTSSMMQQAGAIEKHGVISGHPVLDVNLILQGFWNNIKEPCEDVEKKAPNWKTLPIAEIRELRQLKNRLKVIAALADSDRYVLDENLNSWLSLRDKLP